MVKVKGLLTPLSTVQPIQTLHRLRKCRQIIQLYGYLPNAILPTGQVPALLLQQPSYGSLRQFLDHHFSSIQWPERYKLALDMAQGLKYLSTQHVPCNMHSGNVLIDGEGVAILTGFGNPKAMVATAPTHMTSQPSSSALLVYMAPEKISGTGGYSPDWEIFSLGILLWELSSGRMPFDEIITRAESGPRLVKNMEQLSTAIVKGLREEPIPGTPEIYEQLFKMCWDADGESRPPIEVVEETLQMLVVVEPMDMLMLPGEESNMPVSTVLSDSIDADSLSGRGSNSVRSVSPVPSYARSFARPITLHQAISVSNADMTSWYILSGHDLNGFAIVPTYSHECEITPIQTCLGHFLPSSLPIFKELLELDADITLVAKFSLHNCLHILFDRYIPVKNERGSAHLMEVVDILLATEKLDVNAQDVQGYTPLHLLMRNPKISSDDVALIMKKMVDKGADTSIQAQRDGNVLALATKYLHFEAAKQILNTDISASEPVSIDKAIESCMTMTGRATDKFVNLRAKTRELLKMWTGKAALARREKVCVKVLQDAGQLDVTGVRFKGKPVKLVPKSQLDCANVYYEANVRKVRDNLFSVYLVQPSMR
ncbi:serine/threonine protein kinase [Podila verticillata NRRL 6337]|nr:serine/threonine protein kinase [Podila verticillata NRRL 6337]